MNLFNEVTNAVHLPTLVKKFTYLEEVPGCKDDSCKCTVWKGHCPLGDCFIVNGNNQDMQFMINPRTHRIFYCLGCKKGGDAISFVGALFDKGIRNSVDFLIEGIDDEQKRRELRRIYDEDLLAYQKVREEHERKQQGAAKGNADSSEDPSVLGN